MPSMAKSFEYIAMTVECIGVNMKLSEPMTEHLNKAYTGIVEILNEVK